ncbi:MAG: PSD1 and planctomycete cytochrome C domain-containing protein [Planctomycetaceae bacterium]
MIFLRIEVLIQLVLFVGFASFVQAADQKPTAEELAFFEKKIRPVLVQHCYSCHSAKAAKTQKLKGGLLLDSRAGIRKGGESGPAVVPGDVKKGELLPALKHETFEMPPKGKLPKQVIADFEKWIKMGAPDPRDGKAVIANSQIDFEASRKFWSFRPLKPVQPPRIGKSAWVRTDIDRFILAKLQQAKLKPNELASPRTLIRRAYFDLIGLPPTPQEIEEFLKASQTDFSAAYEKLIDRLLASPHYGERWARHWMDVARFAESHGYEQDYNRPHAYTYRDFLIRAFNADLPYDKFVSWQIAGDELAPENPLAMTATGFLGGGAFPTQLTESEFERARYDELDDMVATTGVAFLGLSVGCARCHDHKYDPIPSADYYRLASVFTSTIRSEIDLMLPGQSKKTKAQVTSEGFKHMKHHADGRGFPHFYPKTFHLIRGDVHQKKEEAQPGMLRVLMRNGKEASYWKQSPPKNWKRTSFRRAGLARWLTDVENGAGHLTARVIVNRIWQHHFGRGIVATPNDFGTQGARPTHPKLLDWLANDLISHGWKMKRLHKLMMTSAVYMQGIQTDPVRSKIDPDNNLLWRRTPRRLEAEPLRDAMLAVSGTLDPTMYGPGSLDPNMRRRSIYFLIKRSKLIPMMLLFDWPEHLVSIGQRSQTTIAPQALMFLNGPQVRQYARNFAIRLEKESSGEFIRMAFLRALGRPPKPAELVATQEFLATQAKRYKRSGKSNGDHLAKIDFCQTLFSMNEFLFID